MSSVPTHPPVPIFEAFIVPHRSMSPRRAGMMAAAMALLSAAIALQFLLLGAWPVLIFSLLEDPLLGLLLAINIRRARASELILLDRQSITVTQTDPRGRRHSFSLPAAWLRINLEAGAGGSRIILTSRGQWREIGAFLHEPDRAMLFEALRSAMRDVRTPSYDNPQLREC